MKHAVRLTLWMVAAVFVCTNTASAQDARTLEDPMITFGNARGAIDFFFLQPSGFLYFDESGEPEEKIDLYDDGESSFSVELASLDLGLMFGKKSNNQLSRRFRFAVNGGIGITNPVEGEARVFMAKAGFVLQIKSFIRFEAGRIAGWTSDEDFAGDNRRDASTYVGITLPTMLSGVIKKAL